MGSQSSGKCCRARAAIPPGAAAKEHLCPLCVVVPDVPCLCRPALRAAWQVQRGQPVQPAARGVLHRHPGAAALRLQVRLLPSPPRAAFSLPSTSCGLEYLASPKGLFWGEILLCFTEIKRSQLLFTNCSIQSCQGSSCGSALAQFLVHRLLCFPISTGSTGENTLAVLAKLDLRTVSCTELPRGYLGWNCQPRS